MTTVPRFTETSVLDRFTRYGWGVLAYNLLVILWGAYVRASGSGAGCGAHWPLCNGVVIPREAALETMIELTHRATSGVALLLVVGQLVWARRILERGSAARIAAHAAMFLMLTETLGGAGLVLFQMVADNTSIARAWWLAAHLVNTFLLIAALALVPWFAGGAPAPRRGPIGSEGWLLVAGLAGTLFLGMTGAVSAHLVERLRIIHPTFAVGMAIVLVLGAGVAAAKRPGRATRELGLILTALVVLQLVAGLVNLISLAPIPLQLLHRLVADCLWLTLVLLFTATLATPPRESTP